jgi:hypothetical protein
VVPWYLKSIRCQNSNADWWTHPEFKNLFISVCKSEKMGMQEVNMHRLILFTTMAIIFQQPIDAVTTPSKSWDFRGCSSSVIADSITGLQVTIAGYGGVSTCSSDGVYLNGDSSSYMYIANSWYWDGTSGCSFEV